MSPAPSIRNVLCEDSLVENCGIADAWVGRGREESKARARRSADAAETEAEALLQLLPGAEERRTEWAGDLLGDGQLVQRICSLSTLFLLYGRRQVVAG